MYAPFREVTPGRDTLSGHFVIAFLLERFGVKKRGRLLLCASVIGADISAKEECTININMQPKGKEVRSGKLAYPWPYLAQPRVMLWL